MEESESLSAAPASSIAPKFAIEVYDVEKHWPAIEGWWQGYGRNIPRRELLSDYGFVVTDEGIAIAAVWAYFMPTSFLGHLGFPVTNPKIGRRKKIRALALGLKVGEDFLKSMGMKAVHAYVDNSALTQLLNRQGFDIMKPHDFLVKQFN